MDTAFTLFYRPHRGSEAHCDVRIVRRPGRRVVVIVTERLDNPGMSVTNAAERIATLIAQQHGLDPARTAWIEHYPDRHPPGMEGDRMFDESFDQITFDWDAHLRAANPRWRRIDREQLQRQIEEDDEELHRAWYYRDEAAADPWFNRDETLVWLCDACAMATSGVAHASEDDLNDDPCWLCGL